MLFFYYSKYMYTYYYCESFVQEQGGYIANQDTLMQYTKYTKWEFVHLLRIHIRDPGRASAQCPYSSHPIRLYKITILREFFMYIYIILSSSKINLSLINKKLNFGYFFIPLLYFCLPVIFQLHFIFLMIVNFAKKIRHAEPVVITNITSQFTPSTGSHIYIYI